MGTRNLQAILGCRELKSELVRHAARCALIERIAQERRQGAPLEIVRLLREVDCPLPVAICRAVADFFDPSAPQRKTGPKSSRFEKVVARWQAAEVLGEALRRVGEPGGPRNITEARGEACDKLGISERTLSNRTAGPFRSVVEWARRGLGPGEVSSEQSDEITRLFLQQLK